MHFLAPTPDLTVDGMASGEPGLVFRVRMDRKRRRRPRAPSLDACPGNDGILLELASVAYGSALLLCPNWPLTHAITEASGACASPADLQDVVRALPSIGEPEAVHQALHCKACKKQPTA